MNCVDQLLSRRSIRQFKKEKVSNEVLEKILDAGRLAPSATNIQPWRFLVIRDYEGKKACSFAGYNNWTVDADFITVGLYKPSEVMMEHLTVMDVTIALQNMVCAGWLQGVGSCWIGAWNDANLRKVLELPVDSKIVALIAFGVPDVIPPQPKKKSIESIVHYDKW